MTRVLHSAKIVIRNHFKEEAAVAYTTPTIEEYAAGEVVKYEPKSNGQTNKRKRKPHILAVINEN